MTEDEKASYDAAMTKFQEHCISQSNISVENYKLNTREQGQAESFVFFVSDLRKLSATCDFETLSDRLIKARMVQGVLKANLLAKAGLSLI